MGEKKNRKKVGPDGYIYNLGPKFYDNLGYTQYSKVTLSYTIEFVSK